MAASTATPGYGAIASWGGTAIPEVVSITGPGITRDAIDVSHLQSTSMVREFIAGIIDAGEVSLEINLLPDDTQQALLFASMISTVASCAKQALVVTLTDATPQTITMAGAVITGWETGAAIDDKLTATVTFKASGAISIG